MMDSLPKLSTPLSNVVPLPSTVAYLAYGGLLPFLVLTLGAVFYPEHLAFWRDTQLSYGAIVLSFVGALHWAFAMSLSELSTRQRSERLVWSVVPALLGLLALRLPPLLAGGLLVVGFVAHYWQDRHLNEVSNLPLWYLPLRFRLTGVVCVCLAVSAFFGRD